MTAAKFMISKGYNLNDANVQLQMTDMIEFARFHVKKALKAASEQAYVEYVDLETDEIFDYTDVITDDNVGADVNVKSILKSYPLTLIK